MIYIILALALGFCIGYIVAKPKKKISSIPFLVGKVSEEERREMYKQSD